MITLTIIGVIAALTIPNLIAKHEKEETTAKLKKVYSTLSQATQKSIIDNGPINTWGDRKSSDNFSEKYLIPYLKVGKNCKFNATGDCYYAFGYLNPQLEKTEMTHYWYRFFLNDGTLIGVGDYLTSVTLRVDINGKKGPNISGKDVFLLQYVFNSNDSLYSNIVPWSISPGMKVANIQTRGDYACNKNAVAYAGNQCAAKIMLDGWRIKDDYPW